jgi:hypothetical protein
MVNRAIEASRFGARVWRLPFVVKRLGILVFAGKAAS